METGDSDSRCHLCGDKTRRWRDPGRLLGVLNFCLIVAGLVYVVVLHREVSGLRTELGRFSGAVVTPARQTGNDQVDVRVVESDETEEDGLVYGNRHVTEMETRPDAPSQGRRHDVQKRATPVEVSASKRKRAKKNRRRHRKRGIDEDFDETLEPSIKALHMEAQMPSSVGPITGDDVRALDLGGKLTKDGYSPPPGEDHDDMKFRYWTAAQWTRRFAPKHHYNPTTGQTAVHEGGLYFIYSQITISFDGVRWGYSIYVDNDPVFTCVSQKPKNASNEVLTNTCTTSGVVLLTSGQTISIGVQNEDIRAVMKAKLSYWGMIKLANIPKARE